MLAENIKVSVNHDDYWGIEGGADGSENKPYIISTVDDLKTLASFINAGENYEGKYFNLGADIEFPHETTWDAVSTRAENNFTAIGTNDNPFKGIFNGKGHTIRGIRIYKPDELRQGLFGYLGEGAVVDSTKLADVIITGSANVGGIAGLNDYGKIRNCTVDSALIKGIRGSAYHFGGIVGFNVDGTVSGCTSSATLVSEGKKSLDFGGIVGNNNGTISGCMSSATLVSTNNDGYSYGGIAGCNYGNLNDNAVIGATIPAVENSGAVVGYDDGSLLNNYYATCTVAGENATNVGVGGKNFPSDVTNGNGAVSVSVTAPTAVENLVYDGSSHNLVTGGETNYGTMYYSLDGKAYSAEIPAASGANAYTVYYKVMKEEKWTVFDAQTLEVSIAQVPLTVTAKDKSIIYGDDPANDGVEYSGFIGDETASVLGGKLTYSYDYKKLDNVGKYTITPGGLTADNYDIKFVAGTLNVGKADVSVTAPVANEKLVYSGSAQELVAAGSTNFGTLLYSLDNKDYSAEIPAAADASAYTLYYKVAGSDNWNAFDAKKVEVSIAQAPLTITAKDKGIIYGDEPANDGVEYSGFIGDETASVLGGKLTYSYDYKKLDKAGKYAITPSGLTASNYEITFIPGTLNVGKADVSVVAPVANEKLVYSGKAQELVSAGSTDYGTLLYSLDGKDYSAEIPAAADASAYTVYYKVASSDNWNGVDAETVEVSIAKADVSVKAPVAKEKLVYSGKAQELVSAGSTDYGTMLYSLDGKKFSEKIPTATDAKTYTVYYKVAEGDNWNGFDAKKVEVKIAEKYTSAIRRVDARTDKYKMQRNYDLKGRKVQGKAKAPGAYYGKKVLNK
jgi:hypothetical protein